MKAGFNTNYKSFVFTNNRKKWNVADRDQLSRLVNDGYDVDTIARKMGLGVRIIEREVAKLNHKSKALALSDFGD